MRRYMLFLLSLMCITMSVSCNSRSDKSKVYFTGKVTELYEGSCLVEVTDMGNQYIIVGNEVAVHTDVEGCPEYSVGDYLTIEFDGMVAESYPPQIFNVFSIEKK